MPQLQLLLTAAILTDPATNPRTSVDAEADGLLTSSIRTHGVLQAIGVRRDGDVCRLVWGSRRLRCAGPAGLDAIPAVVLDRDMTETEYKLLAWAENHARENLTGAEQAEFIEGLARTEPTWINSVLGERLGLSGSSITAYRSVRAAHPDVWQAFRDGLPLNAAYDLAKLPHADQPAALLAHRAKPKARRGRKPKADGGPAVRVNRIKLMLPGDGPGPTATVVVTAPGLDLEGLIHLLKRLVSEAKAADDRRYDIAAMARSLADRCAGPGGDGAD